MEKTKQSANKIALKHYVNQIRIDWFLAVPTILLAGIGNILVFYAPPLVIAALINELGNKQTIDVSDTIPFLVAFGVVWMIGEGFWRLTFYLMIKFETRTLGRLYEYSMQQIMKKDLFFFHDNFVGALTKRVTGYSQRFIQFYDTLIFNVASYLLPVIFAGFVLWRFSPWLVVVLIGMTAIVVALAFPLIKRRAKMVKEREFAMTVLSGHISDALSNVGAVKAFANESSELETNRHHAQSYVGLARKSWDYQNMRVDMMISPFYVITNVLGLAVALSIGKSAVDVATIFVTFSYFSTITRFFWEFNSTYRRLEESIAEAALFTQLLIDTPKITNNTTKKLVKPKGSVVFNSIGFHYKDNEENETLFKDFYLAIRPGERIGLVGHSGAGKSTITNLLLRFMDVDDGAITIDKQDIKNVTQESLRSNIAYVPQEPMLFHRTLRENISYGKLHATEKEIVAAAKLAHASEFIDKLPKKYETVVGERGVKLSGGQRQRIAIARAILKDAPILVLDEATSALDSESEKLIQDALTKLMKNRTSIVIAHRLSTVQKMDTIVVLDNGKIIEQGSHHELLSRKGTYAKLWAHQSGGFLEE